MYAFVNLKSGTGRAFEAYATEMGKPAGELMAAILTQWVQDQKLKVPPAEDMGEGLDRFTRVFLKMRDTKSQLKKAFDTEEANIKGQMEKVEVHLLKTLNDAGVKSMKTNSATFYKEKVFKPSCSDWDAFYNFIKENDAFEFLERRVTKSAVEAHMKETGGLPPGVSALTEFEVRVRRGSDN